MLVRTKYRDVPWSEIAQIHEPVMVDDRINWEEAMRGQTIEIQVPALPDTDGCGGPCIA